MQTHDCGTAIIAKSICWLNLQYISMTRVVILSVPQAFQRFTAEIASIFGGLCVY